ncbi:hypothetical protein B0H14DRAFT_2573538 [Mycena olivaceomarginata]|nr:hypothetical protein B0H14DRAFT_2573538 [Mycena olivaceomarginata]
MSSVGYTRGSLYEGLRVDPTTSITCYVPQIAVKLSLSGHVVDLLGIDNLTFKHDKSRDFKPSMPTDTTLCWECLRTDGTPLTGIPRLYEAEITEFGSKTRFTLHAGALSLRPTVHQISLAAFKFRFTSAQLEIELFTYCRIYASVPIGSTPAFSTSWAEILVVKHPILLREREMQLIYRTIGSFITFHSPCKSHQESGRNLRTEYIVQPIETLRLNWTSSTVMFKATYDRNPIELRFYKAPSRSAQKRQHACKMYLHLFPDEPAYFVGNNPRFATGNPLVELLYDSPVKTCPLGLKAPHCMLKERNHTVPLIRMEIEEGGESSYGFGTNFDNFCDLIADCFDFLPQKQTMILAHSRAALPNSAPRLPRTLQNMAMNEWQHTSFSLLAWSFHWAESPLPVAVVITVSNERKP